MHNYLEDYTVYPLEGNHDFGTANCQAFTAVDPMLAFNMRIWGDYMDDSAKK
jgi:hypothetical protein